MPQEIDSIEVLYKRIKNLPANGFPGSRKVAVQYFLRDLFQLKDNIEKTSLNEEDKKIRLEDLAEKLSVCQ